MPETKTLDASNVRKHLVQKYHVWVLVRRLTSSVGMYICAAHHLHSVRYAIATGPAEAGHAACLACQHTVEHVCAYLACVTVLSFPANEIIVPQLGCGLKSGVMPQRCICLVGLEV